MIKAQQYEAFSLATQNGDFSTVSYLLKLAAEKSQEMIAADNFAAFRKTFQGGYLPVIDYLIKQAPDKVNLMIRSNNYHAFRLAAENDHLEALQYLTKLAPNQVCSMIEADNFYAFRWAAYKGNLSILEFLAEQAPDKLQEMIAADNYFAFYKAAQNGNLLVLKYLAKQVPEKLQEMIRANNYESVTSAALGGHLDVLQFLITHHSGPIKEIIAVNNYQVLYRSAANGNLSTVKYLIKLIENKLDSHDVNYCDNAFILAIACGQLVVLKYLCRKFPEKIEQIIADLDYQVLSEAARKNVSVLKFLAKKAPVKFQTMVAAKEYAAFTAAAQAGNVSALKYLVKILPHKVNNMIRARNYSAYSGAIQNKHLSVLKYFEQIAPQEAQSFLRYSDYQALLEAVQTGSLSIIKYLLKHQEPATIERMISAYTFAPFRTACGQGFDEVANCLIAYPSVFAYAEELLEKYTESYVKHFINAELESLKQKKILSSKIYSDKIDEISPEKVKQLFYVARALIRRFAPLEDLILVLEIPEVKAIAHLSVNEGATNELLKLSQDLNHIGAFEYLLSIDAIREQAEANRFYQDQIETGIRISEIIQDKESSLRSLNEKEKRRLKSLKRHYIAENSQDIDRIFEEFRSFLIKGYDKEPACITVSDLEGNRNKLLLPYDWESFESLKLSKEERQQAFTAYYKNKSHTAWRYLSKPNPWMHPKALYTKQNELGQWSYYESYKELISILFLAAKDKNIDGIDGYSVEARLAQFIDEINHIARAHNWDKSRAVLNNKGIATIEEFDDQEGDNPSCYSGTKRRLFQAVQGHPLLKQLTINILCEELREFVWHHFQTNISERNCDVIVNSWQKIIETLPLNKEEEESLDSLNLSKAKLDHWIEGLRNKYGEQIDCYEDYLYKKFNLKEKENHFVHFSYLGLDQLLQKKFFINKLSQLKKEIKGIYDVFLKTKLEILIKEISKLSQSEGINLGITSSLDNILDLTFLLIKNEKVKGKEKVCLSTFVGKIKKIKCSDALKEMLWDLVILNQKKSFRFEENLFKTEYDEASYKNKEEKSTLMYSKSLF